IRAKCCSCGSTKDVTYQEIEGGPGTIKAECCGECRTYVKVLHHQKDISLDPIADDVASLGLDLLVRATGLRRGGGNPFLIGYGGGRWRKRPTHFAACLRSTRC